MAFLRELISEVNIKNRENKISQLLGLNKNKEFMPSIANIIGTDLSQYKIIKKGQFACSLMQVARDGLVPICILEEYEEAIMSSAYYIFEVTNPIIIPEYLMLFFKTKRFDDNAMFFSSGGIRGTLTWDRFLDIQVPVPSLEEQKKYINEYYILKECIQVKEAINNNLSNILHYRFHNMFVDKIKSIEENKKCEGWNTVQLDDLVKVVDNRGKTPVVTSEITQYPLLEIGAIRTPGRIISYENVEKYVKEDVYNTWFRAGHPKDYDILLSTVGSVAETKIFLGNIGCIAQNIVGLRCINITYALYLYEYLNFYKNKLMSYEIGSVQASIKVSNVIKMKIQIPPLVLLKEFNELSMCITKIMYDNSMEIIKLQNLKELIITRLS